VVFRRGALLEELVRAGAGELDGLFDQVLLQLLALLVDQAVGVAGHSLGALFGVRQETLDLALAGDDERSLRGRGVGVGVLEVALVLLGAFLRLIEHRSRVVDVLADRDPALLQAFDDGLLPERKVKRHEDAEVDEHRDEGGAMLVR
jgi:hypothetical protein